jgi:hypothetical protein
MGPRPWNEKAGNGNLFEETCTTTGSHSEGGIVPFVTKNAHRISDRDRRIIESTRPSGVLGKSSSMKCGRNNKGIFIAINRLEIRINATIV